MNELTMTQKDIFRLSAVLYAETNDMVSLSDIQSEIIRCIIATNGNEMLSYDEIAEKVASTYFYHITEDEIIQAITRTEGKTFEVKRANGLDTVKLTTAAYKQTQNSMEKNIDYFIDLFVSESSKYDKEECRDAIHKYLYELTTTNLNSYKVLLGKSKSNQFLDSDLSVDVKEINDKERDMVHSFIEWDNTEKNITLSNIVLCCLEYCLLINGDKVNPIVQNIIRHRSVFLDTNIIFRALGINGNSRKNVINAFLKKCQEGKINLIVLDKTEEEFFGTVSYYISEITKYPRGQVFLGAYEMLSDYNMFSFYESWRKKHSNLSLTYFSDYIRSLYLSFCNEFGIKKDNIPSDVLNSPAFKESCDQYIISIQNKKALNKEYSVSDDLVNSPRNKHDATLIAYIEMLRSRTEEKEDIFFVSTDKVLRLWDMTRTTNTYPVLVYPSQLFLILIKMVGRSENDFKSFVSFINVRPRSNQLTPEKANIIISGISSVTEDVQTQKEIVEAVFNADFQNVIQHSNTDMDLFNNVQQFSQKYLENEMNEMNSKISDLSHAMQAQEEALQQIQKERNIIAAMAETAGQKANEKEIVITQMSDELRKKEELINSLAKKGTKRKYIFKVYILPSLLGFLVLFFVAFIVLQFAFADREWNFVVKLFNWMKTTPFGSLVANYAYVVDAALAGALWFVLKKWMRNPFNKLKKKALRDELIQEYINKNNLRIE